MRLTQIQETARGESFLIKPADDKQRCTGVLSGGRDEVSARFIELRSQTNSTRFYGVSLCEVASAERFIALIRLGWFKTQSRLKEFCFF